MTLVVRSSPVDVDAWTRTFAAEQARRAGMPLRDWLIQFVAERTAQAEATPATAVSDSEVAFEPGVNVEPARQMEWSSALDADQHPETVVAVAEGPSEAAPIGATAEVVAEPAPDPAPDLEGLVSALREIAGQVQAANVWIPGGERPMGQLIESSWAPSRGAADAMAQLGADLGRLIEVVDCGYERIEAIGALRDAELRAEMAQLTLGAGTPADDAQPPPVTVFEAAVAETRPTETDEAPPAVLPVVPASFGRAAGRFFDGEEDEAPIALADGPAEQAAEDRDLGFAVQEATRLQAPLGALDPQRDEWLFADTDAPATAEPFAPEPPALAAPTPRNAMFPWLGRRQGGLRKIA